MIKLDAHKAVHFCDGLTRRDFLHAGALGLGGLGLTLADLFALKAAGAVRTDKDVNCICLFLVGAPSQLDTWDMKPDAPVRDPRSVQADQDQRPGHPDQRDLPADGAARRQVRAGAVGLLRRRRGARHRAPGDADRPAVPGGHRVAARRLGARVSQGTEGRHPAARAAAAAHRQHRRQHAARPDRPASSARRTIRSCSNSDPVGPELQGARPAAAGLPHGDPRRPAAQPARRWSTARSASFEASPDARLLELARSIRPTR